MLAAFVLGGKLHRAVGNRACTSLRSGVHRHDVLAGWVDLGDDGSLRRTAEHDDLGAILRDARVDGVGSLDRLGHIDRIPTIYASSMEPAIVVSEERRKPPSVHNNGWLNQKAISS